MTSIRREIPWSDRELLNPEPLLDREWIVTNGLGGYASGTISGVTTRRYHGFLIAALPAPLGRTVVLNNILEFVTFPDGTKTQLSGEERLSCSLQMHGACFLTNFRLEMGLPVWRYEAKDVAIERRVLLRYRQNTVQVSYTLSGNAPVKLDLRPCLRFRPQNQPVTTSLGASYAVRFIDDICEISAGPGLPALRVLVEGHDAPFTLDRIRVEELIYRLEASLGYESREDLWSPGYFSVNLSPGEKVVLTASTESPDIVRALTPDEAFAAELIRREFMLGAVNPKDRDGLAAELALAADQFIVIPVTRQHDAARINARGDEIRTVIAGYHWFADWGRDTMISLEGLTLLTGRYAEAGWILRTFGSYIRDGLIPNMFPEGQEEARYNTADATLWFFHALGRYLEYTKDQSTLTQLLPKLLEVVEYHLRGTRFNIRVDPADGLLTQGEQDLPLTWMDAKVGDWVVTPRRGKAVEINALWYNALRLLEQWCRKAGRDKDAEAMAIHAGRAKESFNQRFWYETGGHLYDVVDGERGGNDASCRPNQILAISLPYPVLDENRWLPVIEAVTEKLLTPVGLRTLSPDNSEYKPRYYGDIRARDAAYHQGTVWPWLLGPFIDAYLKVYPEDKAGARKILGEIEAHLSQACIGSISEICDADAPFTPRGCISQAWSVAEFLRAWVKTST